MSEKLDALRKSAQRANAEVKTSSTSEPFIPGIVEEQPNQKTKELSTPKERTVIGADGNPVVRREADLSTLPEDVEQEELSGDVVTETLKPGGVFEKYLAKKYKEAQDYLATKTFKDDEIEQTPDGEDISVDLDQPELDDDEKELESAYAEDKGSTTYEKKEVARSSEEEEAEYMENQDKYERADEQQEEELVDLTEVSDEEKQEAVDEMKEKDAEKKKIIIPAGEILDDTYEYPENIDLPDEDEMSRTIEAAAKSAPEAPEQVKEAVRATSYHLDVSDYADTDEDDDMAELLDKEDDDEEEQEKLLTDLRAQITEKIKPTIAARSIKGFTVVKSAKIDTAVPKATGRSAAKWVLHNTGIIIEMSEFGGSEIDYLRDNNNWRVVTQARNALKMMYDHVVSPKPQKFENWMKSIAFSDVDDLFICSYIAGFANSNYIPYTCINDRCKYMYLSENIPIMDMIKFKKDGRKKFDALYNSNRTNGGGLYVAEAVPVSERYALAMVVPSLYDVFIEGGSYSAGFREKYKRNIGIIPYIDSIYEINWETQEMVQKEYQVFENNPTKTAKSKAIFYSKVLDTLSTDEYAMVYAMMNSLEERSDWYSFQIPESSCPKCKGKIEAEPATARDVFFTRHRLGLLAITSIK